MEDVRVSGGDRTGLGVSPHDQSGRVRLTDCCTLYWCRLVEVLLEFVPLGPDDLFDQVEFNLRGEDPEGARLRVNLKAERVKVKRDVASSWQLDVDGNLRRVNQ